MIYLRWLSGHLAPGDNTGRYYVEDITKFMQNLDQGVFEGIPTTLDEYGRGSGGYQLVWGIRILQQGVDHHPRAIGMMQNTELTLCSVPYLYYWTDGRDFG